MACRKILNRRRSDITSQRQRSFPGSSWRGAWGVTLLAISSAYPQLTGAPTVAEAFFPTQSTLIILVGIPGDSESEKTYQDQLSAWLEIASGRVSRIFVLSDSPELPSPPSTPKVEVLKGDRSHFLGLGKLLSGTTNPFVVIAWGHGGMQGTMPVLHVRGPRLTPDDFVNLAAQLPGVLSHWVLWFRGSGAFARQLAGSTRQVLASDCDTRFSSDPVGMQLLLKIFRSTPEISFAQLAENLGRATATWYADRNLARTEEPTLWLAEEKPRLLGGDDLGESKPASPSAQRGEGKQADESNKDHSKVQPSSADLPPVWAGIKRVKAESFPENDAVILRQRLTCTLGNQPAIVSEQEQFVQILSAEGKHYGDFDVSYSPPDEELEFLDCEVLGPNGKLVRLDPDAIAEAGESSMGDYPMGRRKFFSLPGVTPGAVVHVRYRSQWKSFPLPRISLELPLSQDLPAQECIVQVSVPKGAPFHYPFEQVSAPDPILCQSSYSTSFCWQLANIPAQTREVLASPHHQARLLLSTFPDWSSFTEWYGRIIKLSSEVTPEIEAKARELMRESPTEKEKVLAAYNYVTGLRYVAIPLGVNSVRPHAAANVLQNQFGDCKDKANLFNTLLAAANIEAHLVLVPRFSQAYDEIPGLAFNHAISQVRLSSEVLWVDTTDEVCRFGLLPPGDPERKVLVVDGHTTKLTQLPAAAPNQHHLQIHGELRWVESSDVLTTKLSSTASGFPDYELRTAARAAKEHRAAVALLAAKFRPVAGSFAVEQQSATSPSALAENFSWQAQGTWVGLCASGDSHYALHSPFWLPKEWDLALNQRQQPLFLNEGYPLTLDEDFEFVLPGSIGAIELPPLRASEEGSLRWRVEWARIGDDKLVARFHALLARGELSESETGAVQQQLRGLLSTLGSDARFVCW